MRKTFTIPDCGGGLNLDLLPAELKPGVWSSATNYVFRNGFAEPWNGMWQMLAADYEMRWAAPYVIAGAHQTFFATPTKFYRATYLGVVTELTRKTDGQVISTLTSSGTTATLVTAAAHGLSTGNTVTVYGAAPDAYNGTYSITVTNATTFTYTMGSDPVDTATTKGAYHGSATSNFTSLSATQRPSGGMFNGVFYYNHPTDGLYYYDSTAGYLRKVPAFASTSAWHKAQAVRFFKDYILALYTTEDSTEYRQRVRWSTATAFGSLPTAFTGTSTNDAGEDLLTEAPGYLVDGVALGNAFILYMKDARYAMRYIGGPTVFVFEKLHGDDGALGIDCVAQYPGGHIVFTAEWDVKVHDGGPMRSIAEARIKNYLTENVALGSATRSFVAVDPKDELAYVVWPTGDATNGCDRAFVWSWKDDAWGSVTFPTGTHTSAGVFYGASDLWTYDPAGLNSAYQSNSLAMCAYVGSSSASNGLWGNADVYADRSWLGSTPTYSLARTGLVFGDRSRMKAIHRTRWNCDDTGSMSVQHGASKFADTAPTYASAGTYTIGTTDMVSGRSTQGRFLALSITSGKKFRSVDIEYSEGGTR